MMSKKLKIHKSLLVHVGIEKNKWNTVIQLYDKCFQMLQYFQHFDIREVTCEKTRTSSEFVFD